MNDIETDYVKRFYETNAHCFSNTRYKAWDTFEEFVKTLDTKSKIIELGCGNGKNLIYLQKQGFNDLTGVDNCEELLKICRDSCIGETKFINFDVCDENFTTHITNNYDVVICIAVLHHIPSQQRRETLIKNIRNISHSNTKILLTVWKATGKNNSSELIEFKNPITNTKSKRYIHSFTEKELIELISPYLTIDKIYESCDNFYVEMRL
jgi:alkylated DNA repair protein alkB family protein 8